MCWRWEAPTYSDPYVAYPELYDPLGSTWGPAGTLTTARRQHTASAYIRPWAWARSSRPAGMGTPGAVPSIRKCTKT